MTLIWLIWVKKVIDNQKLYQLIYHLPLVLEIITHLYEMKISFPKSCFNVLQMFPNNPSEMILVWLCFIVLILIMSTWFPDRLRCNEQIESTIWLRPLTSYLYEVQFELDVCLKSQFFCKKESTMWIRHLRNCLYEVKILCKEESTTFNKLSVSLCGHNLEWRRIDVKCLIFAVVPTWRVCTKVYP